MIEKGVLIDLVHSTPLARRRIFEINDEYGTSKRPLLFSHSGVSDLFNNDKYPEDKHYGPDREEILKVKKCNGVIGLVFMNYWLSGIDEKFPKFEPGMEYVFNTIQMIHSVTNSYDNIAIGSDFDAMNNPSDDLFNHSLIPGLMQYLSKKGISDNDLDKITSKNALRVLKEGWGI
jgi:membrane dipeptidase